MPQKKEDGLKTKMYGVLVMILNGQPNQLMLTFIDYNLISFLITNTTKIRMFKLIVDTVGPVSKPEPKR